MRSEGLVHIGEIISDMLERGWLDVEPIKLKFDICARCKCIIPKENPYVIARIMSGKHEGKTIPAKGVLCEPCMTEEYLVFLTDNPACVVLMDMYH